MPRRIPGSKVLAGILKSYRLSKMIVGAKWLVTVFLCPQPLAHQKPASFAWQKSRLHSFQGHLSQSDIKIWVFWPFKGASVANDPLATLSSNSSPFGSDVYNQSLFTGITAYICKLSPWLDTIMANPKGFSFLAKPNCESQTAADTLAHTFTASVSLNLEAQGSFLCHCRHWSVG